MVKPEVRQALMIEAAFNAASDDVRSECWTHIFDAIDQVQGASSAEQRKAMLAKLPSHIRARVEEWVKAYWGVEVVYAGSPDLELRHLPLCGITSLVRKKGP